MVIFSKVRLGVSPDINALATIMVALVTMGVVIAVSSSPDKKNCGNGTYRWPVRRAADKVDGTTLQADNRGIVPAAV